MIKTNNEAILQFAHKGLPISEGITINVRLVMPDSKPIRDDDIKKLKNRNTPEGRIDRDGRPIKFFMYSTQKVGRVT